jgi:hypothetical protein
MQEKESSTGYRYRPNYVNVKKKRCAAFLPL